MRGRNHEDGYAESNLELGMNLIRARAGSKHSLTHDNVAPCPHSIGFVHDELVLPSEVRHRASRRESPRSDTALQMRVMSRISDHLQP